MKVVGYDSSSFQISDAEGGTETSVNMLTGKATVNGKPKKHDVSAVAAGDCAAVEKLATMELR